MAERQRLRRSALIRVWMDDDVEAVIDFLVAGKVIVAADSNEKKNLAVEDCLTAAAGEAVRRMASLREQSRATIVEAQKSALDHDIVAAGVAAQRRILEREAAAQEKDDDIYTDAGRGVAHDRDPKDSSFSTDC